jgi:DNA-binding sugar fermentation-stimulating protein
MCFDLLYNVCLKHFSFYGYVYIKARTDTTQQSGQTPDMEVEIKNITVYVSGYTETPDSRGR